MSDLTNKDAEQDTKIAVMDSTLENAIRRIEMVHSRIDKTEEQIKELKKQVTDNKIWIQRASAVIGAAVASYWNYCCNATRRRFKGDEPWER